MSAPPEVAKSNQGYVEGMAGSASASSSYNTTNRNCQLHPKHEAESNAVAGSVDALASVGTGQNKAVLDQAEVGLRFLTYFQAHLRGPEA